MNYLEQEQFLNEFFYKNTINGIRKNWGRKSLYYPLALSTIITLLMPMFLFLFNPIKFSKWNLFAFIPMIVFLLMMFAYDLYVRKNVKKKIGTLLKEEVSFDERWFQLRSALFIYEAIEKSEEIAKPFFDEKFIEHYSKIYESKKYALITDVIMENKLASVVVAFALIAFDNFLGSMQPNIHAYFEMYILSSKYWYVLIAFLLFSVILGVYMFMSTMVLFFNTTERHYRTKLFFLKKYIAYYESIKECGNNASNPQV